MDRVWRSRAHTMGAVQSRLIALCLYAPAPFFGYPHKPLLNALFGGAYAPTYAHFRQQHMDGRNLLYHVFALVWQLSSNWALLDRLDAGLDARLGGGGDPAAMGGKRQRPRRRRILANATSFAWALVLLRSSPAPVAVKLASCAALYLAHTKLGALFAANWRRIVYLQVFIEAAAINLLVRNKTAPFSKLSAVYIPLRTWLCRWLMAREGILVKDPGTKRRINQGLVAAMSVAAMTGGLTPCVTMGLYGWAVALLTGKKETYFWSCGMLATLCQGVAHRLSGELGTLEVLQRDDIDQTQYELSHVVYFPNLLFHAIHAHLGL